MVKTSDIRVAGVSLPAKKNADIALTYIYGIGHTLSNKICEGAHIDKKAKLYQLNDNEIEALREQVEHYTVEGDLRREVGMNIKQLMDKRCYRGLRHRKNLPMRGQQTKNNARTRKGRKGKRSA
jgi:small subunit ribosomal protein S13